MKLCIAPPQLQRRRSALAALRAGIALMVCTAMLSGCQTDPVKPYGTPAIKLPEQFRNAPAASDEAGQRKAESMPNAPPPDQVLKSADTSEPWWHALGSEELNQLIDRALKNNPDLRIAGLQLQQAKIRSEQAKAAGLPSLSAPVQAAIQAPGGTVGSIPVPGTSYASQKSYTVSLQGQWHLDLWGEQAGLEDSAMRQVWRATYEYENTKRNLIASLASAYVTYQNTSDALRLARDSETVGQAVVDTMEARIKAGDATLDELEQKRGAQHVLQQTVPALEQQLEEARNTVAFLVGTVPGDISLAEQGLQTLALPEPANTLPSALLFQRPDIRAVEARMRAAHADIRVARARLLPPIDLSAQGGLSAATLAQMLQPTSFFWNALSGVVISIFDGGRKELDKAYAESYYREMVETYGRTVLQAVREVEGSLIGLRSSRARLMAQQAAVRDGLKQYHLSQSAFRLGALDQTYLLDSQRGYQKYLEDEQRLKGEYLKAYIGLKQALGESADDKLVGERTLSGVAEKDSVGASAK